MLRYCNCSIVFQEVPDEVTLAVNISGCPNRCPGCHSPWLLEDEGEPLTDDNLHALINRYAGEITCICFMGGDADPAGIQSLSLLAKKSFPGIKTAWYSGVESLSEYINPESFDYIKIGPYIEALGGLSSEKTNQRMFRITGRGNIEDITYKFRK